MWKPNADRLTLRLLPPPSNASSDEYLKVEIKTIKKTTALLTSIFLVPSTFQSPVKRVY